MIAGVEGRMDPVVLWARALLVTLLAVFLGAAGHVTADGLLPGPGVLALVVVVGSVASAALLSRPASTLRVVGLLVAGQAAVHAVLTATGGHVGDAPTSPGRAAAEPAGAVLPLVDGRRMGSLQEAYESGSHAVAPALPVGHLLDDLSAHAPMMAVHLVAAVLVGLWLAAGERALWTLVALASAVVLRPLLLALALVLAAPVVVTTPAHAPATRPARRPTDLLARCVVRRGPPLLAA
ncbi:hypothetical protein [Nocardioides sp. Arc9.136]|uniref:hypothetical protein n=1 Tax=Nocardioides sp. Arc9.136 TaxID=2996826 RepID=UPI002666C520|nr:hypothetical protein [Nocardioides sp. Arc9.136]WKN47062.1 hypothetical protein OSR43_13540 [Nocardioides sp. Arc9.136]